MSSSAAEVGSSWTAGVDHLHGGPGADTVSGGEAVDSIHMEWGHGPDTIHGGSGIDQLNLDFRNATEAVTLELGDPGTLSTFRQL